MSFDYEKRCATRLLDAIENGSLAADDTLPLFIGADPALVYMIFAWLRVRYHPGNSASDGVLGRIVRLCTESPKVAQMARLGEKDPIVVWFEETYEYRDFDRTEFISMIVEKLEG
jgi:hypothetical protein